MGLDMYLVGEHEGGKTELGYWRKHPNLHGYIVQNFAGGVDECQRIDLSASDMENILQAVMAQRLPYTTGFFFGKSTPEDDPGTISILQDALKWVRASVNRRVYYYASW